MIGKPTAPRVISGTHGYVYWDNDIVFEVSSASASIKPDREDVTFAGDMWKDSKLLALGGEFTIKVRKVFSRAKKISESFAKGQDPRSELIFKLDDPDAYGAERIALHNCWFNDLSLIDFENGKLSEDEFSGGFTSHNYLDYIDKEAL